MTVTRRSSPPASAFLGDMGSFYHWDSYEAPLRRAGCHNEIYLPSFAHPPRGFTELLILRDRSWRHCCDLRRPTARPSRQAGYTVGEKIARFTLFGQNDTEIVTGGDDTHLDFRVSAEAGRQWRQPRGAQHGSEPAQSLGRTYLSLILPFHRYGVRMLLANAVEAGRL